MSVVLTEYKFSGEMVTMQKFRLNKLEEPLGDATTVHYMKMFNVEKDNGIMDEIDSRLLSVTVLGSRFSVVPRLC